MLPGDFSSLYEPAQEICRVFEFQLLNVSHCRESALFWLFPLGLASKVLEEDDQDWTRWIKEMLDTSKITKGYGTGNNQYAYVLAPSKHGLTPPAMGQGGYSGLVSQQPWLWNALWPCNATCSTSPVTNAHSYSDSGVADTFQGLAVTSFLKSPGRGTEQTPEDDQEQACNLFPSSLVPNADIIAVNSERFQAAPAAYTGCSCG